MNEYGLLRYEERMAYSQYSLRIEELERELEELYHISKSEGQYPTYFMACSLAKHMSDDDLSSAIESRIVSLPSPFIDKSLFQKNIQSMQETIERHNGRLYDLERDTVILLGMEEEMKQSIVAKREEMQQVAMHIGILNYQIYELSNRIPVNAREFFLSISRIIEELTEIHMKRAELFTFVPQVD
jgi:hypothetical protein